MFSVALTVLRSILFYYALLGSIAGGLIAVFQERRVWKDKSLPSLSTWGMIKVFAFNFIWMNSMIVASTLLMIKWIVTASKRSVIETQANTIVEFFGAWILIKFVNGDVVVEGRENLPPKDQVPAPIYVANHASQSDIASVYFMRRQFKWISKQQTLVLPGVGQIMWLSGHVFIDRKKGKNKKSLSNLFEKSSEALQAGVPMFFYPQGTRRIGKKLPFKDGAFIVGEMNPKTCYVPVSINVPMNIWNSLYPLSLLWTKERPVVKITVHKPIPTGPKEERENIKKKCMDQIYSVLPPVYGADNDKED